ncbi:hypothetical protein Hanom_Chr09g00855011 [Helianthus anomalus]
MISVGYRQWRNLKFFTGGSKTYILKNFYRTGGSRTYIPKNFYTKTTYITLLAEKFGGSGAPPGPFKASPMGIGIHLTALNMVCISIKKQL